MYTTPTTFRTTFDYLNHSDEDHFSARMSCCLKLKYTQMKGNSTT